MRSYGSVFRGIKKGTDEVYAIKIIKTKLLSDSGIVGEIEFMKSTEHSSLVAYHGSYYKKQELWVIPSL